MRKPLLVALVVGALGVSFESYVPAVKLPVPDYSRKDRRADIAVRVGSNANNVSVLTRSNFDDVVHALYDSIGLDRYDLKFDIFRKAMIGYFSLVQEGALANDRLLTIINFELPGTKKRFYTIDLVERRVRYHTYVAHGRNTGENFATIFSNTPHSNQSSLGFYITAESYFGSKGYSLRLDGREEKFNSNIRSRAVVIHGADYATENWISRYGRLGRSQGCPALPPALNKEVIDAIKEGSAIFTYYPDDHYLRTSNYLKAERLFATLDQRPVELITKGT